MNLSVSQQIISAVMIAIVMGIVLWGLIHEPKQKGLEKGKH